MGAAMCVWSGPPASLLVGEQTAQLRLVSTAWPPFTNPPGRPRFALDLVEEALDRIGVSATTTIVSPWKDPEREHALIFSQPYLENRLVLVGRYGGDVSAAALSDLTGKRVAIVEGYSYGDALDRSGPILVRSQSEEDSLSRLLKGAVDYALMDELVVNYIVSRYPNESSTRLQIGSRPLLMRGLHFALARAREDAESIVARFNAQLRGMLADRTYHRLLHMDWIRGDIDGDGVPEYVPLNDRPGPTEPQHIYTLLSPLAPETAPGTPAKPGFYLGGTIYSDWASVPESYKDVNPHPPDSRRSTASIFEFTW
jgi:polar amino acid transport system substrate-binding protein